MDRSPEQQRDPTLMGNEHARGSTRGLLRHLSDMDDFEIVDGEPDIRGWTVRSSDGVKIGEVNDLIVDYGSLSVRYIQVELDDHMSPDDEDRRVLLPLGTARLNDDDDVVTVRATSSDVARAPRYRRDADEISDAEGLHRRHGHGVRHDDRDMDSFFGNRRSSNRSAYLRRR